VPPVLGVIPLQECKTVLGPGRFHGRQRNPAYRCPQLGAVHVNLSQVLLRNFCRTLPESSVLDLKAYFRAAKYFRETVKMHPQKPGPILLEQIFGQVASLGCIHPVNVQHSSP
jgi:hypothetical protein